LVTREATSSTWSLLPACDDLSPYLYACPRIRGGWRSIVPGAGCPRAIATCSTGLSKSCGVTFEFERPGPTGPSHGATPTRYPRSPRAGETVLTRSLRPSWLGRHGSAVMARPSFGTTGSWLAITPTCQRFDLWVEPASGVALSPVHNRHVLFDHDNLSRVVPPAPMPAPPSPDKLRGLGHRFSSVASVARVADDLLMLQVIWALRWVLYNAYVESNRPLPPAGLKQWSAKLTDAQRETFVELPTSGDPEPIIKALADVLGELPPRLPDPVLQDVVVPPEGSVRGLDIGSVLPGTWGRHVAAEYLALHLYRTVVLHRCDWLLGALGANNARKLLYELALEANGRRPAASPADWGGRLTRAQRGDLLAIPAGAADLQGVLGAHLGGRKVFTQRGREILGDAWPTEMEAAVTTRVDPVVATTVAKVAEATDRAGS
jgi:hypothetical protein